jgi:hypothetical protein
MPEGRGALYGEYALARTIVTVTVSDPASPAAAAKDNSSVSNVVTITNNAASGKAETPPASAAAKDPAAPKTELEWCTALRASYNTDRVSTLVFMQERAAFVAKLGNWQASGIPPAERATATGTIEKFLVALKKEAETKNRANANLTLISNRCPQRFTVEIKETTEADISQTYRLHGKVDIFSSDHVTTEFEGGLLKSVSATADSQASQTIVALAKSVAMFTMPGLPATSGQDVGSLNTRMLDQIFAKIRKQGPTPALLDQLMVQIPDPSSDLPDIDVRLPFQRAFTLEELTSAPVVLREELALILRTACTEVPKGPAGQPRTTTSEGVFVSAERVCTLEVPDTADFAAAKATPFAATKPLRARATIVASDSRYSYRLPIERTAFVKRASTYTFSNGRLAKVDYDHPSSAVEIVSIPFKVVGAFVGSVADGIRGRQGVIDARTNQIKAETARIQAATEYAAAKNADDDDDNGSEDQ